MGFSDHYCATTTIGATSGRHMCPFLFVYRAIMTNLQCVYGTETHITFTFGPQSHICQEES